MEYQEESGRILRKQVVRTEPTRGNVQWQPFVLAVWSEAFESLSGRQFMWARFCVLWSRRPTAYIYMNKDAENLYTGIDKYRAPGRHGT
jgi:hypothetical protein